MGPVKKTTLLLAIAVVGASSPVAAQDYEWAAGYNVGGVWFSALNDGGGGGTELGLDAGWIVGLQFERWLGSGRLGMRVNGAITERPLTLPGQNRDIGVWVADADFMLRLMPADPERTFNMFVSAGGGMVRYKLGRGDFINIGDANASYPGDDDPEWAIAAGLGMDFLTSWRWDEQPIGIRFEVVDHYALESPFTPISGGDFSPIHNVRFVIGLFSGFGVLR
jgi:hypothetical protein